MRLTSKQINILILSSEAHYREVIKKVPSYRKGQAYFNILHTIHPGLANEVAGTDKDPFYDDSRIETLLSWLAHAPNQ